MTWVCHVLKGEHFADGLGYGLNYQLDHPLMDTKNTNLPQSTMLRFLENANVYCSLSLYLNERSLKQADS
jgi:hypothetical protein